MSQIIEHEPQQHKYKSRIARFWASRTYAFRATAYGLIGGVAVLGCAALETCLPSSGAIAFSKFITPVITASPFAATVLDAVDQYRQMSKIPGIPKLDAARIAAEAGLKVGLMNTTTAWLMILTPLMIQQNHLANSDYPSVRNFVDFALIGTVYVISPVMSWMMRTDSKDMLRRKFGISTLVIDDLHPTSTEPRDVTPHKPAPADTPRITDAKLKPFVID
ncbi:MAG: hypothetical protein SFW65_06050 [Alphaproteobacteria bacterium]|nr:hypothetical protein [Alphaproteobacteria bacterium]